MAEAGEIVDLPVHGRETLMFNVDGQLALRLRDMVRTGVAGSEDVTVQETLEIALHTLGEVLLSEDGGHHLTTASTVATCTMHWEPHKGFDGEGAP